MGHHGLPVTAPSKLRWRLLFLHAETGHQISIRHDAIVAVNPDGEDGGATCWVCLQGGKSIHVANTPDEVTEIVRQIDAEVGVREVRA